jgi:hypothetical protein
MGLFPSKDGILIVKIRKSGTTSKFGLFFNHGESVIFG